MTRLGLAAGQPVPHGPYLLFLCKELRGSAGPTVCIYCFSWFCFSRVCVFGDPSAVTIK